jgi:hypothetical protein
MATNEKVSSLYSKEDGDLLGANKKAQAQRKNDDNKNAGQHR